MRTIAGLIFSALVLVFCTAVNAEGIAPKVKFLPAEQIQEMICEPDANCLDVVAVYDKTTGTIILRDTFDPKNEYDLSVYLHEFTHHLQAISGYARSDGRCDEERHAYTTQRAWLKERGHKDPYKVMGIDRFTELMITKCHYN